MLIICNDCQHEFRRTKYRKYADKQYLYDQNNNTIKCPECNSIELSSCKTGTFQAEGLTKFGLKSKQQKIASLRKRSDEHFDKKIKDKKHFINSQFKKNVEHKFKSE